MLLLHRSGRNFATKLQASASNNNKDPPGKRLGVKKFGGEEVFPNDILVRQRGMKWKAGLNTFFTRDHTIHSKVEGQVKFTHAHAHGRRFTTIHVLPKTLATRKQPVPKPYTYHPEMYPELAAFNAPFTDFKLRNQTQKSKTPHSPIKRAGREPPLDLADFLGNIAPVEKQKVQTIEEQIEAYNQRREKHYARVSDFIAALTPHE